MHIVGYIIIQIINNQAIKERYLNHEIKPQTANYKALAVLFFMITQH